MTHDPQLSPPRLLETPALTAAQRRLLDAAQPSTPSMQVRRRLAERLARDTAPATKRATGTDGR